MMGCPRLDEDGLREGLSWLSKANRDLQMEVEQLHQTNTTLQERVEALNGRNRRLQSTLVEERVNREWDMISVLEQHYRAITPRDAGTAWAEEAHGDQRAAALPLASVQEAHAGSAGPARVPRTPGSGDTDTAWGSEADTDEELGGAAPTTGGTTASTAASGDRKWVPISSRAEPLQAEHSMPKLTRVALEAQRLQEQ